MPEHWTAAELAKWHDLYEYRSQFDGAAARMAARAVRCGTASASALHLCLERMKALGETDDHTAFLEADMQFHRTIVAMAGVETMLESWLLLEEAIRPFAAWVHRSLLRDLASIAATHGPIYEAIAVGDERMAERLAQLDLDSIWQVLASEYAGASDDPVRRICAHVHLNLHRRLVFAEIARDVGCLSTGHAARLFRERRGESFQSYVQSLRMRRAGELLRKTDLAIGEVATRVGYNDVSRFGVHFRRHFGESPLRWKREHA